MWGSWTAKAPAKATQLLLLLLLLLGTKSASW
jgi:hypothetical protein